MQAEVAFCAHLNCHGSYAQRSGVLAACGKLQYGLRSPSTTLAPVVPQVQVYLHGNSDFIRRCNMCTFDAAAIPEPCIAPGHCDHQLSRLC